MGTYKNIAIGATLSALLSGCSSIESTHVMRDQYGIVKGKKFDGVPVVVTIPDKLGFLVTETTYRVTTERIVDNKPTGEFDVREETVTTMDKTPISLGTSEVFTVDVRRPASGTAKNKITLEGQYPTEISNDVDDNTLIDAVKAVGDLKGLTENADSVPGGAGAPQNETRIVLRTKQYLVVYDPRTGQFTKAV